MLFKSEIQHLLKSFFALVKTQFDRKVRRIQVDNGGEFDFMHLVLLKHGMIHQHSCVSTHHQNGVAERKQRHVLMLLGPLGLISSSNYLLGRVCSDHHLSYQSTSYPISF